MRSVLQGRCSREGGGLQPRMLLAGALLLEPRPSRRAATQGCWSRALPGLRGSDHLWDLLAEEGR